MTPNVTTTTTDPTDATDLPEPGNEPTADLHPDVQAVMAATDRLPVHDDGVTSPVTPPAPDTPSGTVERGTETVELATDSGTVTATLPAGASPTETAAIVSAVAAHLRGEAAEADDSRADRFGRWRLTSRLGHRRQQSLRDPPAKDDVWSAAGRCRRAR